MNCSKEKSLRELFKKDCRAVAGPDNRIAVRHQGTELHVIMNQIKMQIILNWDMPGTAGKEMLVLSSWWTSYSGFLTTTERLLPE